MAPRLNCNVSVDAMSYTTEISKPRIIVKKNAEKFNEFMKTESLAKPYFGDYVKNQVGP